MIRILCNNYCGRIVDKDGDICYSCARELETKERIRKANIFKVTYNGKPDTYTILNTKTNQGIVVSNDELNGLDGEIEKAFKERDDWRGYHP